MNLPTVFLSLVGDDEHFVHQIYKFLPDGLAYFYPRSFRSGEKLLSAMEERAGKATMFVLFASRASLSSSWVNFEIDRARLSMIVNDKMRILVVPIERGLTHNDLPLWMQEYWVIRIGEGPREIARYIRRVLISSLLSDLPQNEVYGRGTLIDTARANLADELLRSGEMPNVLVLGGNTGIGRRTFCRKLLLEAFPGTPELNFGPEFQLPQFADLADLYIALRQEMQTSLSFSEMEEDLRLFGEASNILQAEEIVRRLTYFAELGQGVTVVTGNGVFDERGYLKSWAPELFRQLEADRQIKLVVISNRLLHDRELNSHRNVLQLLVPPIEEADVRTLMIGAMTALGAQPALPGTQVIRSIGGHPGIARVTATLVARRGPAVLDSDPSDLFALQEDVLSESLDFASLSPVEKDVLSILSWVPQLGGDLLRTIIITRHGIGGKEFAETVYGLILACLIEVSGTLYQITAPVRSLFRRLHGYGSTELMSAFSSTLKSAWDRALDDDDLRTELLDAFTYMLALEGGTLPRELRSLLLPSKLQEIVRDTYDRNHDNPEALRRVVAWGLPAMTMGMDETTREEILSYVIRALTRLGEDKEAERILTFFYKRSYRSRFYLHAFYMRLHKGDHQEAIRYLREARKVRKYMARVVGELAACYQRLGMWAELHRLVQEEERHIERNPVLLNVHIGMLIAQGDFEAAERAISTLRSFERQEAIADARTAMIMMKRDQNHRGAQTLLTSRMQRGSDANKIVRRLRAIAAASAGDLQTARSDAEFLQARSPNYRAHDIEARIKLFESDYDGAEGALQRGGGVSVQDKLLRARILDAMANDARTAFAERERLRQEAAEIRARNRMLDEYEIEP